MNKYVYILTIILLLCATTASAETVNIILTSPSDSTEIKTYTQDFIFDFDDEPDMINCSLILNEEIEKTRNAMIARNNNKLTVELEAGDYSWFIQCIDSNHKEITSETRSLTVNLDQDISEGYEIIYYTTGLRGYKFTIAPGQESVEMPAMLAGEDMRFVIGKNTHYVDIIKMGAHINTTFIDVRDRTSGKIHKILLSDSIELDFDDDEQVDVKITFDDVERGVKAFFIVEPYPGTEAIVEEPEPEPEPAPEEEEEELEEEETSETEEPTQEPGEETVEEEEPKEETEDTEPFIAPPPEKKNYTWLIILIVVVIVIIVGIVLLKPKDKKKVKEVKQAKPGKSKKEEQEPPEKKVAVEKLDVVKSVSRGKKR